MSPTQLPPEGGGGDGATTTLTPVSTNNRNNNNKAVDPFGVVLNDFLSDLSFCPNVAAAASSSSSPTVDDMNSTTISHELTTPEATINDMAAVANEASADDSPAASQLLLLSDAAELTFSSVASLEELSPRGSSPLSEGSSDDQVVLDPSSDQQRESCAVVNDELSGQSHQPTAESPPPHSLSTSSSSFTSISAPYAAENDEDHKAQAASAATIDPTEPTHDDGNGGITNPQPVVAKPCPRSDDDDRENWTLLARLNLDSDGSTEAPIGTNPQDEVAVKSRPDRAGASLPSLDDDSGVPEAGPEPFCVKSWLEASGNLLEKHLEGRHHGVDPDNIADELDDDDDDDIEIEEVSATEVEEMDVMSDAGDHDGIIPRHVTPTLPQHIDVQAWLEASGGLLEKHLQHRQRQISSSDGANIHRLSPSDADAPEVPAITTEPGGATELPLPSAPSDPDVTSWLQLAGAKLEKHLQQRLLSQPSNAPDDDSEDSKDDDASAMTDVEVVDDDEGDCSGVAESGQGFDGRNRAISSINIDEWLAHSGNRLEQHLLQRQERMDEGGVVDNGGLVSPAYVPQRGMPTMSVRAWLQASGGMLEQHLLQRNNHERPSQLLERSENESVRHSGNDGTEDVAPVREVDPDEGDTDAPRFTHVTHNPASSSALSVDSVRDWLHDASNILERKIQQRRQSMVPTVHVEEELVEVEEVVLEDELDNDPDSRSSVRDGVTPRNDNHSVIQPHGELVYDHEPDEEVVLLDECGANTDGILEPKSAIPSVNVRSWLKDTAVVLEQMLEARQVDKDQRSQRREEVADFGPRTASGALGQNCTNGDQQVSGPSTAAHDRPEKADIRDWLARSAGEVEVRLQDRIGIPANAHSSDYDEVTVIDDDLLEDDDAEPKTDGVATPTTNEQHALVQNTEPAKASPQKVDVRNWLETTASLLDRKLLSRPQQSPADQYDEITIVDDEPTGKPCASSKNQGLSQPAFDEETVIEEIEEDDVDESDDEGGGDGSSDGMDSSSSAYEEQPPKATKGELPPNVLEWMESTALLIQQLQHLKGTQQGDEQDAAGLHGTTSCPENMQDSADEFDGASQPADGVSGASDYSRSHQWVGSSNVDSEGNQSESEAGEGSQSAHSVSGHSLGMSHNSSRDMSSNGDSNGSQIGDLESYDFSGDDDESTSIARETDAPATHGPFPSISSNSVPSRLNSLSSRKLRHQKMDLGGLNNFLESKIQQRQQDYCKSVHLEAEDDESESDEGEHPKERSSPPEQRSRLAPVLESDVGSVPSSPFSSAALTTSSPRPTLDSSSEASASPKPSPMTTTPVSPIRRATKASIPAAPYSFSAVSVSFLALNVKASTAAKVFEEALRILRPGGRVYLVDYDGRTVGKLPDNWRGLLRRVDQFDPDEMQLHGMQEEEIRKILSCVGGSARGAQCLDPGYALARWVGVLPPNFSLY